MKRCLIPVILLILAAAVGIVSAQSPEPTQTPYIIYVVVTATPEPAPPAEDVTVIQRPSNADSLSLVNGGGSSAVSLANQTTNDIAASTEDLVQRVVATVMAQTGAAGVTTAGGTVVQNTAASSGGAIVRNSDGTTCTMNFELVSEPTYRPGAIVARGEVFWKEWVIRNTGTCTWTPAWSFVFDSGWQIGNTRFSMNKTTAPGATLTVRLGMVPDQPPNGNYYSTYAFEAPDGTQYGKITSSYTVKDASYFAPKPTIPPEKRKPQHGYPGPWHPFPPGPPGPPPDPGPKPPHPGPPGPPPPPKP